MSNGSANPQLTLAPLHGLYAVAARPLIQWASVAPEEIPEPQRSLLVHQRDMTRTLEQFYQGRIRLRVLSSRRDGAHYWRESVLELNGSGEAIEFGAIQIFLDRCPEPWRGLILGEERPLGGILNESGLPYTSRPSGYFRCVPDAFIRAALRVTDPSVSALYGRQNTLTGADGLPLAEIVEILPPASFRTPDAPYGRAVMSTAVPAAPAARKINLRRPDVMEAVAAQVVTHYRSELVERLRARGGEITHGGLTIKLAKEFGFCYGVERAIDLAYAARKVFPPPTRIFLLGEIIHNPEVNDQIRNLGIVSIPPKPTDADLTALNLTAEDVAIVPAFGTEVSTRRKLEAMGCQLVDTTCGDVMSVWKRVRQYSKESVTSIIHGKARHEETKATTSQATAYGSGHYLVVFDLQETDYVCDYLVKGGDREAFLTKFKGAYSPGFDPDQHLTAIGVANQTTMLRGETEEVQRRFKAAIEKRHGPGKAESHFRFFDTICGATQDRQDALQKMLREPMDLLIVVGGYNSSNTSHLAEMGEKVLPTYFIKNAAKMMSAERIEHWNQHTAEELVTQSWYRTSGPMTVGITAGASCPNNLIEDTIKRLFELRGVSIADVLQH